MGHLAWGPGNLSRVTRLVREPGPGQLQNEVTATSHGCLLRGSVRSGLEGTSPWAVPADARGSAEGLCVEGALNWVQAEGAELV